MSFFALGAAICLTAFHVQKMVFPCCLIIIFRFDTFLTTCSQRSSQLHIDCNSTKRTLELASGLFGGATRSGLHRPRKSNKCMKKARYARQHSATAGQRGDLHADISEATGQKKAGSRISSTPGSPAVAQCSWWPRQYQVVRSIFCGGVEFRRSTIPPWIFTVDKWMRGQQVWVRRRGRQ